MKAKWLVTFLVGLSLFYSLTGASSGVAHLAHLGGAPAAFLYLKSAFAPSPYGAVIPKPKKPKREWKVLSSGSGEPSRKDISAARASTAPQAREIHRALDEVDRILDKISADGIASLTEDERRRLDEASRRFRSN